MDIETVKIKVPVTKGNEEGSCIINAEDFDAKTMQLFDAEPVKKPVVKRAVKQTNG